MSAEWPREVRRREDIADIRAGPSGISVNERPVRERQVHPRSGKKVSLLTGRDEAELRWMATHLRRALGISPAKQSEAVP